MTRKDDYLYIFLHLPKCAGLTIQHHILKNVKTNEVLQFPDDLKIFFKEELANISITKNHRNVYKLGILDGHITSGQNILIDSINKYLCTLSAAKKDQVRVICGHAVPYGIHKYFNKEPRYVTFVRNPVERVISSYNYLCSQYYRKDRSGNENIDYDTCLLYQDEVPSFEKWLEMKYNNVPYDPVCVQNSHVIMYHQMVSILQELGYIKDFHSDEELKEQLKKFYFLGITDSGQEDFHYLYKMLKLKRFWGNQNVSQINYVPSLSTESQKKIISKNRLDEILYRCAVEINAEFRRRTSDYALRTPLKHNTIFLNEILLNIKQRIPGIRKLYVS